MNNLIPIRPPREKEIFLDYVAADCKKNRERRNARERRRETMNNLSVAVLVVCAMGGSFLLGMLVG